MKFVRLAFLLWVAFCCIATPARCLVIIPTFDSSITNDPNAATIEATINMAMQFYATRFADPITVNIKYQKMSSGLGENDYYFYPISYITFLNYLKKDATTTNDTLALAHLPLNTINPVTGDTSIYVNTANLRAIGLNGLPSQLPGGYDGIVSLNTSIMNLSRASNNPAKYDLLSVVRHETDEVLTLGSDLPDQVHPFPQDLFRYNSAGARSFTTSGDDAWFSLDSTNLLARFNQDSGGDYGDWWSGSGHIPRVQDAFAVAGVIPKMNVELTALDVAGYDLLPPPKPAITNFVINGSNLAISGTNGMAAGTYLLLTTTNLTQWTPVATNFFTNSGNFTFTATNVVTPSAGEQFYMLDLLQD